MKIEFVILSEATRSPWLLALQRNNSKRWPYLILYAGVPFQVLYKFLSSGVPYNYESHAAIV